MNNQIIQRKLELVINNLLKQSTKHIENKIPLHQIEKEILPELLKLGLTLLEQIIIKKKEHLKDQEFITEEVYKSNGYRDRKYLSLFGEMTINREVLSAQGSGLLYPLDEYLSLPKGTKWSYNLQELVGESASENDFNESVRLINKLLYLNLSGKSSERNTNSLAVYVDDYYELYPKEKEESAVCFCASFDGKGVPKIRAKDALIINAKSRRKKGEKPNVMQMATVSVSSMFTPKKQTAEGILTSLLGQEKEEVKSVIKPVKVSRKNDNKWHQKIHRRAFLANQSKAVDYGIKDIKNRMQNLNSRFVVPIDAGIGLEEKVLKSIEKYKLTEQFDGIILDIIHVSEYVWTAANALLGEKSNQRLSWVRSRLTSILNSQTQQVIKELEQVIKVKKLSKAKKGKIQKVITYFTNHLHKMDYQKFIVKGYPVSSAIVESTCKHLVKERMEQSGMRWSSVGAQDMLDLRAVKLNDDMEDFIQYVIKKERKPIIFKTAA